MYWPLLLFIPIILLIAGIAISPDLLTNPGLYFEKRKKLNDSFKNARSERTLYKTEFIILKIPMMLGNSEYRASGFPTVYFKESCLYFKTLGLIKFYLPYDEVESIHIEKSTLSVWHSRQLKFKLKDKGRASLVFGISRRNDNISYEIEKATGIPIIRQ